MSGAIKEKRTTVFVSLTDIDPRYIAYNKFKSKLYKKLFSINKTFKNNSNVLDENKKEEFEYYKMLYQINQKDVLSEIPFNIFKKMSYDKFLKEIKIEVTNEYIIGILKKGFVEPKQLTFLEKKEIRRKEFAKFVKFYYVNIPYLKTQEVEKYFGLSINRLQSMLNQNTLPTQATIDKLKEGMEKYDKDNRS